MALASVVVVGAAGVLLGARSDVGAGADGGVEVVSREDLNGGPWADPASSPSMSADGTVVVFQGQREGVESVAVRDRVAGTTTAVPGAVARNGAVSADGCVVAYATADDDAGPWMATIRDRCADVTFEAPGDHPAALPAPGISADGGLVVWSTVTTLLVLHRDGDTYEPAAAPDDLPQAALLGPDVDVSDDGSVVVLTADSAGTSQVYAWLRDPLLPDAAGSVELVSTTAGDPADGDSTHPTVSGDGVLVAFETLSGELVGQAATPAVVVRDRNEATVRVAAADGIDPDLSSGGRDVVFVRDGAVRLATWSAGGPFETVVETVVAVATDPDADAPPAPAPVVSADGSRVAFTSDQGPTFTSDTRFSTGTHVWLRDRAVLQVADLDLGDVTVGSFVDRTTTVTNAGPVGVALGAPSAAAPFAVVATTCAGVLAPAAVCHVTVRLTPVTESAVTGALTIGDAFDPTRVVSGALSGRGVAPAPSSSSSTTTVPPSSTSSVPSTTVAPSTTVPRVIPRPRVPTTIPRRTTTTTPRVTRPSGTSLLTFSPQLLVLDPVVAGTGRATSVVSLTNVGLASATVTDVSLDPSSGPGFVVDAATCLGLLLAPGTACQIAVEFSTADVGDVTGLLVAAADDGATATVALSASGVEPPVLAATPDVAAHGQVVTVTGAGFPAGEELTLWWGSDAVAVTTDAAGSFRLPLIVMRHTAGGPLTVRVDGAPERFPTTDAAVLVRASGSRPASPAVRPTAGSLIGG